MLNTIPIENDEIQFVTEHQLTEVLKSIPPIKAPGPDLMVNILIKNIPSQGINILTKMFNACLKFSYFPCSWKVAKILPIIKPNKLPYLASSYRPISLLPCLGKIFEILIKLRLKSYIDDHRILIDEQFGFREQHSTTHQVHRIFSHVKHNLSQRKSTGMVLLDLEHAFDTVWIDGLLSKMVTLKFPFYLTKIVKSYLNKRQFYVTVSGANSVHYDILAGVPQGGVLSPLLFNIFINDIPKTDSCQLALYADDAAIFTSDEFSEPIIARINNYLDLLLAFFNDWKLKINTLKCEAIYFTRCRSADKIPQTTINLLGTNLNWKSDVKYLGIYLDSKLTMKLHINNTIEKCKKLLRIYYPILNRKSKFNLNNKLLLYKTMALSVMLYGVPIWWNAAFTNKQKLQVIQNTYLKLILKVPRRYSTSLLHQVLNMKRLDDYAIDINNKYFYKLSFIDNQLLTNIDI